MTTPWTEAIQAIDAAQHVVIVTHVSPDGDAIGSLLGMANALRGMGKTVTAAVDEGVPEYLKFLPGSDTVVDTLSEGTWELAICVDASDESRTGKVGEYARAASPRILNLDHHPTNTRFGDIHLVVPEAVSATEIAFDLLLQMNDAQTPEIAIPLLCGLVTDTLGFRTNNVTGRTLEIAQHLMRFGASLTEITQRTLDTKPFRTVTIWKYALATVALDNGVITAYISLPDLRAAGIEEPDDAGLSSFLVRVDEALVSASFKEQADNTVKLSFRAKPGYDVSQLALSLGGGGHKLAAGATVEGTLEAAKQQVLPLLHEAVSQGKLEIV